MTRVTTKAQGRKAELGERLLAAINEHRANPPARCDRRYAANLALRFGVNRKTMISAIQQLAQLSEEEILNHES